MILAVLSGLLVAGRSAAQAQDRPLAANLNVVQLDWDDTNSSVKVTTTLSLNGFAVGEGSDRGDYRVQVGESAEDDYLGGALLASVSQNGRRSYGTNGYAVCSAHVATNGCRLSTAVPTSASAGNFAEFNVNVAAAWFPYADFLAGTARNSAGANGGTNDLFIGSPGLVLGTHFKGIAGGKSIVDLRSLGVDSRSNGVLLVASAKDENNYALSQVNTTNGTWNVFLRDNAQATYANYEQDPVAFVFIPKTNTTLISGRFNGDGSIAAFSGDTPQFTVTKTGTGQWELLIPGHTPAGGVLIISPEGGGYTNGDNIVSYQANADGDGWVIQSRDTPYNSLETPAETGGAPEAVASFVFIPAPTARLVSPDIHAQNLTTAPVLQAAVSNAASSSLKVTFYGREAATPFPGPDFCIVAMPDTQCYTAQINDGTRAMMYAQTEWAISNRVSRNVAYVTELGDLSNNGDTPSYITQWYYATNAMYRLESPTRTLIADGMPYGIAVGNHEQSPNGWATCGTVGTTDVGTTTNYNKYFGVPHFTGREYYGGHYGTNNNNHFDLFSVSGLDFVVLYFEYNTNPPPELLAWANDVLATNAWRRAIIVTHYAGNAKTPSTLSPQAAAIYDALKGNTNLFLMLGGHVSGEGSRSDFYAGNTVHTLIADYQSYTNGGNGFMRIMEFSPSNNVVTVQTYSPWTGEYETDDDSEFYFSYNMQSRGGHGSPGTAFTALGTNNGVMAGDVVSFPWNGLQTEKTYEWYVTITDEQGNTATSPVWSFISPPNAAPVVANQSVTVTGDAPAQLTLLASDPNGDALTFRLTSSPTHGVNVNIDTNQGTLTYVPNRGYRGSDRFIYQASDGRLSSASVSMNLNVTAPPDTNANGLPDDWEAAYGVADPNADDDADGQSNLQEYYAGTNPTNAASVLQITDWLRLTNGRVSLAWPSVGGSRYRVQYRNATTNNGARGTYTDIVRALTNEMDLSPYGAASTQSFTDDFTLTGGAPPGGSRYYRIRLVQ